MPDKVEVLMNWVCNQNCIFCSVGHKLVSDKGVRTWEEIKKDIDFAKENKVDIISFSGGEPTIRKDIFKAIEYANEVGFEIIEIQSNGRMYKHMDFVKKLVDLGANRFLISIHADRPEIHDFLTRVKGSFEDTVKGLENLKKLEAEKRLLVVINKYNYKILPDIAKFFLKYKARSYHFSFAIPDGYIRDNYNQIVPKMTEAASYIKEATDIILENGGRPSLHNLYPCILLGYENIMADLVTADTILIGPDFKANLKENKWKYG